MSVVRNGQSKLRIMLRGKNISAEVREAIFRLVQKKVSYRQIVLLSDAKFRQLLLQPREWSSPEQRNTLLSLAGLGVRILEASLSSRGRRGATRVIDRRRYKGVCSCSPRLRYERAHGKTSTEMFWTLWKKAVISEKSRNAGFRFAKEHLSWTIRGLEKCAFQRWEKVQPIWIWWATLRETSKRLQVRQNVSTANY